MSLLGLLGGLNAAGVRYVVIGGVAGVAHGSVRVTNDLDICYDPREPNLQALARVLQGWHGYLRDVEPGLPFVLDARTLRAAEVLTLITDEGYLDLFRTVAGVGGYAECLAASEEIDAGDVAFRALGLRALIAAKRAAGRAKDLEQAIELEALLALRQE